MTLSLQEYDQRLRAQAALKLIPGPEPAAIAKPEPTPTEGATYRQALALDRARISFLWLKINGTKEPGGNEWNTYRTRRPTLDELESWFGLKDSGYPSRGLGLICGHVSGNVEVIDVDRADLWDEYLELVENASPGLLARLTIAQTPKPGLHLFYRCEVIDGNKKLARVDEPVAEGEKGAHRNDAGEWVVRRTLIETRGEGGYVVAVGSHFKTHPTHRPYTFLQGDYESIPTITVEEREILLTCARSFNKIPDDPPVGERKGASREDGRKLPGDDFNERGDSRALLIEAGWTPTGRRGSRGEHWTRPGKDAGTSATLFDDGALYVFSSNAYPFDEGNTYTPFAIYAFLKHGGKFDDAARDLGAKGYGQSHSVHSGNSVPNPEGAKPEEWELPAPFGEYDLPAFPLDALPDWLRSYSEGLAVATQTPVDMGAMLGLANCAATLAGKVAARVRDNWTEPTNLYALIVLGVGNRKTAVHDATKEPLEEIEGQLIREAQPEIDGARIERAMLEARLDELKKKAAKSKTKEDRDALISEAKEVAAELTETKVPVSPKLIVSGDITPEALASTLAEQGGRLFLSSDEGELFEMAAGRYGNGANIETLLKAHTGGKIRVNRRGRSEIIENATLTIGMTVQPDVLRGIADKPTFRGRGLCGRFLFSIPKSLVGGRNSRPAPLADEAKNEYMRRLKALAGLEKVTNVDGDLAPRVVKLSRDAADYLTAFMDELEPQMAEGGMLYSIADWATKLSGAIARIATIIHFAEHSHSPGSITEIPDRAIKRAIKIGRYLIPHALAAYAEMGADPQIENAKYLLRWIRKGQLAEFTKREAHRENRGRFKKVVDIEPALELLEAHGYIRPLIRSEREQDPNRKGPQGRKRTQLFEVNPAAFNENSGSPSMDTMDVMDTNTPAAGCVNTTGGENQTSQPVDATDRMDRLDKTQNQSEDSVQSVHSVHIPESFESGDNPASVDNLTHWEKKASEHYERCEGLSETDDEEEFTV